MSINSVFQKVKNDVVADAETAWDDVEDAFTDYAEPFFESAIQLIERNGGSLLLTAAADAVGLLTGSSWATVAAQVVTAAKAAGAQTIASEEQLAASTALQIAQAAAAAPAPQAPSGS